MVNIKPGDLQNRPVITLDDETEIEATLLVGSDGEKSKTRDAHGIGATGYNYIQQGVVCTVKNETKNPAAFQRFLTTGPVALLPLWGDYSSIVWSAPPGMARELKDSSDADFVERLNHVLLDKPEVEWLGGRLDFLSPNRDDELKRPPKIVEVCTPRYMFPLTLTNAEKVAAPRVALIGDAAHRIHPMAGQGLNLGLTDVAYLANVLVKARKSGSDIGNFEHVLQEYDIKSRANATAVISSIEFVKNSYQPKMFASDQLGHLLALSRNVGLDLIQSSDWAKHNFMSFASGTNTHP